MTGPALVVLKGLDELDPTDQRAPGHRSMERLADLFDQLSSTPPDRRPLTVATTGAPWHLDPALFGPGRLDRLVFVPPPSFEARCLALEAGATRRGLAVTGRVSLLAAATVGWSGADLADLLDELHSEDAVPGSQIGPSSMLLDVVSRIVPRTRSWSGRAREMADQWPADGMIDDLLGWLRRAD
jgi:hypothetical protein